MMDIEKTNGSSKYDIVKCKQTSARLLKRAANNRPNNSNGRSNNNEKTTTTAEAVASHQHLPFFRWHVAGWYCVIATMKIKCKYWNDENKGNKNEHNTLHRRVLLLVTARSVPNPTGTRSIELRSTVPDSYWSTKTYGNNYDVR
jgi:hypothetical protein